MMHTLKNGHSLLFQRKNQLTQQEVLEEMQNFRNIATELNVAADLYREEDYSCAMDLYKKAVKAMMITVQPQQNTQQKLSLDEARLYFIQEIVHGKERLQSIISSSRTKQTDKLKSFQWSDSESVFSPKCFSEAMALDQNDSSGDECDSAVILYNMGLVHVKNGKIDIAEQLFNMVIALKDDTTKCFRSAMVFTAVLNNLAFIQYKREQLDKAMENFSFAFQLGEQLLRQFFTTSRETNRAHMYLGTILFNIGMINVYYGFHDKAAHAIDSSLKMQKRALGDSHPDIGTIAFDIGMVHLEIGRVNNAMNAFMESLCVRRFVYGNDHLQVAKVLYNLGRVYDMKGEYDEALHVYQETLRVERIALGENHPDVALTMCQIGQIHHSNSELDRALDIYHDALLIVNAIYSDQHSLMVLILQEISNIYLESGNAREAMTVFAEANDAIQHEVYGNGNIVTVGLVQINDIFTHPPAAAAA